MNFENPQKPTESLLGKLQALKLKAEERAVQAQEQRIAPKKQLEEQLTSTKTRAAEFSALSESGDFNSLKDKVSVFEMYAKMLDSKLDATELRTISKDELVEVGEVVEFLKKELPGAEGEYLQEIGDLRDGVVERLRAMAKKISEQFERLSERYQTQLEDFGDEQLLIKPIEGGEQTWAEKVTDIRKDFIRNFDISIESDKRQKKGSPEMPPVTPNSVYLNEVFNAFTEEVEKSIPDPDKREEYLKAAAIQDDRSFGEETPLELAVAYNRFRNRVLLIKTTETDKTINDLGALKERLAYMIPDHQLSSRAFAELASTPRFKDLFKAGYDGHVFLKQNLRELSGVSASDVRKIIPDITENELINLNILERVSYGNKSLGRQNEILKDLGVNTDSLYTDLAALYAVKRKTSNIMDTVLKYSNQSFVKKVEDRVEYFRNAVLHPNEVNYPANRLLDKEFVPPIKTVGEGQMLAERVRDVAADRFIDLRKRLKEAQDEIYSQRDEKEILGKKAKEAETLKGDLQAKEAEARQLKNQLEITQESLGSKQKEAASYQSTAENVRALLGEKDNELARDREARRRLEEKQRALQEFIREASNTKIGMMGGQKTFDDVMKKLQELI